MSKYRITRDDFDDIIGRVEDGEILDAPRVTQMLSKFSIAGEYDL